MQHQHRHLPVVGRAWRRKVREKSVWLVCRLKYSADAETHLLYPLLIQTPACMIGIPPKRCGVHLLWPSYLGKSSSDPLITHLLREISSPSKLTAWPESVLFVGRSDRSGKPSELFIWTCSVYISSYILLLTTYWFIVTYCILRISFQPRALP